MTDRVKPPRKRPCGSCPYRRDVPSGVWAPDQYAFLPDYDGPTGEQRAQVFMCHQNDGHLCAGWVGCHDMEENLAIRIAVLDGRIDPGDIDAIIDYTTDVALFGSGAETARHGLAEVHAPSERAQRTIDKIARKRPDVEFG